MWGPRADAVSVAGRVRAKHGRTGRLRWAGVCRCPAAAATVRRPCSGRRSCPTYLALCALCAQRVAEDAQLVERQHVGDALVWISKFWGAADGASAGANVGGLAATTAGACAAAAPLGAAAPLPTLSDAHSVASSSRRDTVGASRPPRPPADKRCSAGGGVAAAIAAEAACGTGCRSGVPPTVSSTPDIAQRCWSAANGLMERGSDAAS
eukprot:364942-Chlamydomonas_euryale.AAC.23